MDSERKGGIALIINNKDNRPGSEIDVQKLKTTLEKLNARVETVEFEANAKDIGTEKIDDENLKKILNLPKTEKPCALAETVEVKADGGEDDGKNSIAKIVAEFIKRTDFSKYTWTAIALFSHGLDNEQIMQGTKCINVQKILLNQLIAKKELKDQLKWVILQACRGLHDVHTATSENLTDKQSLRDQQKYYIKSYSSQEGCKSYRLELNRVHQGSFYINSLCENLDKYAKKEDLLSILRRTTESVQKYSAILRFEKAKKAFADSHDTAPKLEEDKKATADSHDTTPKLEEFISVENDRKTQWPQYETNLQLCKFFFDKGIVKPPPSVTDNSIAKDL